MSLIARLFAQPEPPHRLLAPNPQIGQLVASRALAILAFGFMSVLSVVLNVVNIFSYNRVPTNFIAPIISLMFLTSNGLSISFYSMRLRYWMQIEPRRFAAVTEGEHLLSSDQPRPVSYFLGIPITIRMSQLVGSGLMLLYLSLLCALIMLYIFVILMLFEPGLWPWSLLITSLAGIFMVSFFLLITHMRPKLEITQEGIRFKSNSTIPVLMFWHEARLFACYPEPGPWKNNPTMIYELSSASHVFHWTYVRRKSIVSLFTGYSEEDNTQAQALCALVAEKTGLPLYDLSKSKG